MKILVVADVLGKENNGTTIACMNLIRYLKSVGDTVKIVCCDQDKKGLENYYVVSTINFGPILNKVVEKNGVTIAKVDRDVIEEAMFDVDVVHILLPFMLGRAALKIARERHIPVTASFHCQAENLTSHLMLMNSKLANKATYKNFYYHFYKDVNAIHYPTDFIRRIFENDVKHKTNAYVISNGVNNFFMKREVTKPDDFKNEFVILFIGRIAKEKSHKVLIKAVSLSKYKDQIQLVFAGAGPREKETMKYVKRCKIKEPLMKFFSREELVNVINYSDLYCHPAEIEIEAISCLEAISCGLVPVISDSKRSATNAFAIDDKCLFKCNNSQDLARKIDYWIEHPEEKKEYQKKYLDYAKEFEQNYCMERMRDMLIDTINNYHEE